MKNKAVPVFCSLSGTLLLLLVIAFCIPLTLPRLMGYEAYEVVSGSMEPEISVGSVIYVKAAAPEEIEEEEVIAFRCGSSVVTHRVVQNRLSQREFVTKGDANAAEDLRAVPYAEFIGRVVWHFPKAGRLMALYTGSVGKACLILFAACGSMLNMLAGSLRRR